MVEGLYGGFPKYLFGGPHNKDYSILGSILGFPYCGKVPYHPRTRCLEVPYLGL